MSDFPKIVAFYSFKGGVGRSMAVLNVAYAMAAHGRNVLILDMDLEAPGLSGFLERQNEIDRFAGGDMVDLVSWAKDFSSACEQTSKPLEPESFPPLSDYAVGVPADKLEKLHCEYAELGRVDIIPVDAGRDYYGRLTKLALGSFDQETLVRVGSVLRSWLKGRRFSVDVPDYYGPDATRTDTYDYVLVDSRTGISESGGLCIGPLSDYLVVFASLNDQNVEGTRQFLEEVGILAERPENGEDEQPTRLDAKSTLIVASPVPAGEIANKNDRLDELEKALGPVDVKLSYHPQMALMESIFTRDHTDEYLTTEYNTLLDRVFRMARDGTDFDVGDAWSKIGSAPPDKRRKILREAVRSLPVIGQGEFLHALMGRVDPEVLTEDEDFVLLDRACRILSTGTQGGRFDAINRWANILFAWGLCSTPPELPILRREAAMRTYAQVIEADAASANQKANALCNRGVSYGKQGDSQKAIGDYTAALKIQPDKHEALNNWGNALSAQAQTKSGEEADALFARAFEKCSAAESLAPGHAAYNLACICSVRNDEDGCRKWLQVSRSHDQLPARDHLANDPDLENVRSAGWFEEFIAGV